MPTGSADSPFPCRSPTATIAGAICSRPRAREGTSLCGTPSNIRGLRTWGGATCISIPGPFITMSLPRGEYLEGYVKAPRPQPTSTERSFRLRCRYRDFRSLDQVRLQGRAWALEANPRPRPRLQGSGCRWRLVPVHLVRRRNEMARGLRYFSVRCGQFLSVCAHDDLGIREGRCNREGP